MVTKRRLKLTITTTRRTRMQHLQTGDEPEATAYEPSAPKSVGSLPAPETLDPLMEAGDPCANDL